MKLPTTTNAIILTIWIAAALLGWFVLAPIYEKQEAARVRAIVQEELKK
jgi:hypothetical protein